MLYMLFHSSSLIYLISNPTLIFPFPCPYEDLRLHGTLPIKKVTSAGIEKLETIEIIKVRRQEVTSGGTEMHKYILLSKQVIRLDKLLIE